MLQALYYFEVILPKTGIFNDEPQKTKLVELINKTYDLINFFGFLLRDTGTDDKNEAVLDAIEKTLFYYNEVEEIRNLELTEEFMEFVNNHNS